LAAHLGALTRPDGFLGWAGLALRAALARRGRVQTRAKPDPTRTISFSIRIYRDSKADYILDSYRVAYSTYSRHAFRIKMLGRIAR
jgi:hypothetical protein